MFSGLHVLCTGSNWKGIILLGVKTRNFEVVTDSTARLTPRDAGQVRLHQQSGGCIQSRPGS